MHMPSTYAHWSGKDNTLRNRSDDPLNPARGLMVGCVIGAGLWAAILALAFG